MTEEQVDFLAQASFAISQIESNEVRQILKSYYLLKCRRLSRGSGLPQKYFSDAIRCSHCLIEWKKGTKTTLKPVKLSRRQRRRIRSKAKLKNKSINKEFLLHSKVLEKKCLFCNHITKSSVLKPSSSYTQNLEDNKNIKNKIATKKQTIKEIKLNNKEQYQSNVYCKSKVAFSLNKQKNSLSIIKKESQKIIKNNKKKKDKYAGLCQIAVKTAMKLKEVKGQQNVLNLFLKPAA